MGVSEYITTLYKTAGQLNLYVYLCDDERKVSRIKNDVEKMKLIIESIEMEINVLNFE